MVPSLSKLQKQILCHAVRSGSLTTQQALRDIYELPFVTGGRHVDRRQAGYPQVNAAAVAVAKSFSRLAAVIVKQVVASENKKNS